MPVASFPLLGERLERFLDKGGAFRPDRASYAQPHWLYHLSVERLGPPAHWELVCEIEFLQAPDSRRRVDLIAERLQLPGGRYYIRGRELTRDVLLPDAYRLFEPWSGKVDGRSFENALAVALAVAGTFGGTAEVLPEWVLFTGSLGPDLTDLTFGPTARVGEKVRLGLGLDGYERCDLVELLYREAGGLKSGVCETLMGPYGRRVRPGGVRLMFVPEQGLDQIEERLVRTRGGISPSRMHEAAGGGADRLLKVLERDYLVGPGRMIVVGAQSVDEELYFLGYRDRGDADRMCPFRVVSPEPGVVDPPPGTAGGTEVVLRFAGSAVVFCRVDLPGGQVLGFARDAVSHDLYRAITREDAGFHPPVTSPFPAPRRTNAQEAVALAEGWCERLQREVVTPACGGRLAALPVQVRLPTAAEWRAAVTAAELADPGTYAHLGSAMAEAVGSAPRLYPSHVAPVPNEHGLYDLLGNYPELVIGDRGEPALGGWSHEESPWEPEVPRVVPFPPGPAEWSFRPVLEFGDARHWSDFARTTGSDARG